MRSEPKKNRPHLSCENKRFVINVQRLYHLNLLEACTKETWSSDLGRLREGNVDTAIIHVWKLNMMIWNR